MKRMEESTTSTAASHRTIHVLPKGDESSSSSSSSSSWYSENYFAVAINTYERPNMLRDAVNHYADFCGKQAGVGQVFVIWAEQGVPVPEPSSFFVGRRTKRGGSMLKTAADNEPSNHNRAEIHILQKAKNSLNSRFEPIPELKSAGVFMVDDDVRVSCQSLVHAFKVWKKRPDSMVGFYPRLASPPKNDDPNHPPSGKLVYHCWPAVFIERRFNFVLTKASFLHSKYLALYTGTENPQAIKDYVDEHMNCEDIAMAMLVANYTKYTLGTPAKPIFVQGVVQDLGLIGGISTGSEHFSTRSECLSTLNSFFQRKGWGQPLSYHVDLESHSKPSNAAEWFAFANTWT